MTYDIHNTTVVIKRADLTEEDVDAIVNAANSHLQHGGGVAGAIVRKGGRGIQDESNRIGHVPVGNAAITSAGSLKARRVIHAVGPMMGEGDEDAKLRSATLNSLRVAKENGLRSIAFPAVSTGIFGYPLERCAQVMLQAVSEFCAENDALQQIRFCLFDEHALNVFRKAAESIFKQ
jgi:O-acetyl-ADP-ribose deacetylase (regulator of RNase III)